MKAALVNPSWSYDHSIYFGCREPHLPIEFGCAQSMLEAAGHEVLLLDGQLMQQDNAALAEAVRRFRPDMTVVATAPTYLFWRCAPPELRVPAEFLDALDGDGGREVVVGPHGSVTPGPTLRKLGVDLAVRGECEEVIAQLAETEEPRSVAGTAWLAGDEVQVNGTQAAAAFVNQPALHWPAQWIGRHGHHHHRFDEAAQGPGAEVEASRGCPYSCSFCAKIDYRDAYRRRALEPLLEEIDGLLAQGVTYLYFIDEIFLPQKPLLEALVDRRVVFGVQTRIDLWSAPMLELLGNAGCVSIEAGVESLTEEGRAELHKKCRMTTDELADRLVTARRNVPFVQANLIATAGDDPDLVARWRDRLQAENVWANDPVPLYPYPSSPAYRELWGLPDDYAWERAHEFYLKQFARFSDLQDQEPLPLPELERRFAGSHHA
jgi:B12-binding domain/radical SAM domain protein of rhizo-twelve system